MNKPEIDFEKLKELKELLKNVGAIKYEVLKKPTRYLTDPYYQRQIHLKKRHKRRLQLVNIDEIDWT